MNYLFHHLGIFINRLQQMIESYKGKLGLGETEINTLSKILMETFSDFGESAEVTND
jgi:hypothetical protein